MFKSVNIWQMFGLLALDSFKNMLKKWLISIQKREYIFFSRFFKNIYLFLWKRESERASMSGGRAEREGDTESEAGCRLWAVSTEPMWGSNSRTVGLELTNCEIMTWAEVGHLMDWATQMPWGNEFLVDLNNLSFVMWNCECIPVIHRNIFHSLTWCLCEICCLWLKPRRVLGQQETCHH